MILLLLLIGAPSLGWLLESRKMWSLRERYRYRKWRHYVRTKPEGHELRDKWYDLYVEARDNRKRRQRQIKRLGVRGVGSKGVELIKEFEGFSSKPYRDPVGVWTIGYGHIEGVGPNSHSISKKEGTALLHRDLDRKYFPYVRSLPTFKALNQNRVDALVSFVYNVGPGGISSDTKVGRALRRKRWSDAANNLLEWNKAGGRVLAGLTRRRKAECALFLKK